MYELQLKHLQEKARPWTSSKLGFPSKSGGDQGDMVLFNALLSFSGVEEALGYVPACIAPDGRPVRSPE